MPLRLDSEWAYYANRYLLNYKFCSLIDLHLLYFFLPSPKNHTRAMREIRMPYTLKLDLRGWPGRRPEEIHVNSDQIRGVIYQFRLVQFCLEGSK